MISIALTEEVLEFKTELGFVLKATRTWVTVELTDKDGHTLRECEALIDSGAPLSVLPYSLWNVPGVSSQFLGKSLFTMDGKDSSSSLTWLRNDVSCEVRETGVRLFDRKTGIRSPVMRLRGKFPLKPQTSNELKKWEARVILGTCFVKDNGVRLTTQERNGKVESFWIIEQPKPAPGKQSEP